MNTYVSRGGLKLEAALSAFRIDVSELTILDVGSSTGGFVDCLLQNGAAKVYALDTAYGELAWKLRNDPRVVVMERTNILHLESLPTRHSELVSESKESFPSTVAKIPKQVRDDAGVDLVTIDAGWTSLEKVLPKVKQFLKPQGKVIALLKPHYELSAGERFQKDLVNGVLPTERSEQVKEDFIVRLADFGFQLEGVIDSPILGGAGNKEYLLFLS